MKLCSSFDQPPVFILDLSKNGYALARVLTKEKIEVVGFLPQGSYIEALSRLPSKIVRLVESPSENLQLLISEAARYTPLKPVLIFNSDLYQDFLSKYYDELEAHFIFEIPRYDVLKHFLEKDLFTSLALKHNIRLPKSFEVTLTNYQESIANLELSFPLVIKPKYRDDLWELHNPYDKVFVADNFAELEEVCQRLLPIIHLLIVQEWVPGNDSNIYYCLAYITPQGEVLDYYCGQKIHQYPILLGNTSSSVQCDDPYVIAEGLRILTLPGIYGFCSVEFKRHCFTGEYYVIEPTIGRINRQELIALSHRSNFAVKAYYHMIGTPYGREKIQNKVFFIEEYVEVKACFAHMQHNGFSWWRYMKLLFTHKVVFQTMNWRDPIVSARMFVALAKLVVVELFALIFAPGSRKASSTSKLYDTFRHLKK